MDIMRGAGVDVIAEEMATQKTTTHRNPWSSIWHFLLAVALVALVVAVVVIMVAGVAAAGLVLLAIIAIGWPIAALVHHIKGA